MSAEPSVALLTACPPAEWGALPPQLKGQALFVSDRLVREGLLTSVVSFTHRLLFWSGLGREELTRDIPHTTPDTLRHLDLRGIIQVGTTVRTGEILVGKLSPRFLSELTWEQKLFHAVFGRAGEETQNESLRYPHHDTGRVSRTQVRAWNRSHCPRCGEVCSSYHGRVCGYCGSQVSDWVRDDLPREVDIAVEVEVDIQRELRVGDVLYNEQGHACTVARILSAADMPTVGGQRVDVLVAPESAVATGLTQERDGGLVAWKKMTLLLEHKLQARGIGEYDPVSQMPGTGPPDDPGQIATPDTAVALLRRGCPATLMELLTVKADDAADGISRQKAVHQGLAVRANTPMAAVRLSNTLRAAEFVVDLLLRSSAGPTPLPVRLALPEDIHAWSYGEVENSETTNTRTYRPERGGLLCERIFGPERDWECACGKYRGMNYNGTICDRCGVKVTLSGVRREQLGHIDLARPVIHPWFLGKDSPLPPLLGMDRNSLDAVASHRMFVVLEPGQTSYTVGQLLEPAEWGEVADNSCRAESGAEAVGALLSLRGRTDLAGVVLRCLPVLPAGLRPDTWDEETRTLRSHHLTRSYQRLIKANNGLRLFVQRGAPEAVLREESRLLQNAVTAYFRYVEREWREAAGDFLHKPTDFSAWAVVVPDVAVPSGKIGLPQQMARVLLAPLVVGLLLRAGYAGTVEAAQNLADHDPPPPEVAEALPAVLASRPLIVFTEELQAEALPAVLVEGEALRVHPDTGQHLGLCYAGDTLTVHLPLTAAAVNEWQAPRPCADVSSTLLHLFPADLVQSVLQGTALHLTLLDRIGLGVADFLDEQPVQPVAELTRLRPQSLERLELSEEARAWLRTQGISTVGQLLDCSAERLAAFPQADRAVLGEIEGALARRGLELGDAEECVALLQNGSLELASLPFSRRTRKGLRRLGLRTVAELAGRSEEELLDGGILGLRCLEEIREQLRALGLRVL